MLRQTENIRIREATEKDLRSLWEISARLRQSKDADYFDQQLERRKQDGRIVFIIAAGGEDAGYCILNWEPKYAYFKAMNIPEIQDLNVLPDYRRQGLAARLIAYCEVVAVKKGCKIMGISFGLDASYGPAQRLYVKSGYVPDGYGVTYDRKTVQFGEFKPVDDNLCLMMVKNLT